MQYDLKKDLIKETKVAIEWHGADTKVLIYGDAQKTEVKTDDVIEVTLNQAKELLSYSHLWTLKGDKPVKHGYNEAMKKLAKLGAKKEKPATDDDINNVVDLTAVNVDEMEKKEVVKMLKNLGVSFNDRQGADKLAGLLRETIAEKLAADDEKEDGDNSDGEKEDGDDEEEKA